MRVELSAHASPVPAPEKLWQLIASAVSGFRTVVSDWTYRPEEHYMRGPGPKSLRRNSDDRI
jgi:hypothetical protein